MPRKAANASPLLRCHLPLAWKGHSHWLPLCQSHLTLGPFSATKTLLLVPSSLFAQPRLVGPTAKYRRLGDWLTSGGRRRGSQWLTLASGRVWFSGGAGGGPSSGFRTWRWCKPHALTRKPGLAAAFSQSSNACPVSARSFHPALSAWRPHLAGGDPFLVYKRLTSLAPLPGWGPLAVKIAAWTFPLIWIIIPTRRGAALL